MTIQLQIKPILLKYGVKKAALFGSYATNQQNQNSDVDIIIESPKGMGIEFIGLKHELEDTLKKKLICSAITAWTDTSAHTSWNHKE